MSRDAIRERAAAAGKSFPRLVLDLVFAEVADRHVSALTAEELAELLDGFQILVAFVRVLRNQAAHGDDSGTVRGSGVSGDAGAPADLGDGRRVGGRPCTGAAARTVDFALPRRARAAGRLRCGFALWGVRLNVRRKF